MSLNFVDDWEGMWAPYDEPTYSAVLEQIRDDDIVLEIGAGDLRLAKRIAQRAAKTIAIERRSELVGNPGFDLLDNCQVIIADARRIPFPKDISVAVLLMRHCASLAEYWNELKRTRCQKLITNARWRVGIETIDLTIDRVLFESVRLGWYACRCGGTGFVPGEAEQITDRILNRTWEVGGCPACQTGHD